MEWLSKLDYVFWIPLILWVPLFFWFFRYSYPLFFKKMVKKREKWAYIPERFTRSSTAFFEIKFFNISFSLLVSMASSIMVSWFVNHFTRFNPLYGLLSLLLFLMLTILCYQMAMKKVALIFKSAYFLEYRRCHYETESKGNFQSEIDIHNRTIWSFTKKLRNAEAHKRLWKYVNAMAKTKKIPPDLMAEVLYV